MIWTLAGAKNATFVATSLADDLAFPNGMVLTPDGRTLIVAETWMNRLTAFTVHEGTLSEQRIWAAFGPPPTSTNCMEALRQSDAAADGICLDSEGAVWVADAAHNRLLRVAEHGRILEELKTEVAVFACMLGGDDGRTLFACVPPSFRESEASVHSPRLGANEKKSKSPMPACPDARSTSLGSESSVDASLT